MTTMLEKMAAEIHRKVVDIPADPDLLDCRDAARAALLAIREPDEAVILAGQATGNSYDGCDPEASWPAMIDAILNEPATGERNESGT